MAHADMIIAPHTHQLSSECQSGHAKQKQMRLQQPCPPPPPSQVRHITQVYYSPH